MDSTLPPLSPGERLQNRGSGVIAGNVVVATLAILAVGLRIWSRKIKHLKMGLDDWLILAALPFALALAAVTLAAVHFGVGKHLGAISKQQLISEAKAQYASQVLWGAAIPLVKLSILALYVRIFGGLRYIRWAAWFLSAFTIFWAIAIIIVNISQCIPIEALWDTQVPGKCISIVSFFIVGSVPEVVDQFIILFLPMPAVWGLQQPIAQRISILTIFALGSLVCVISIVRLVEISEHGSAKDITWAGYQLFIWSTAEPCLGIVCACLPTMTPLLRKLKLLKNPDSVPRGRRLHDTYNRVTDDGSFKRPTNKRIKLFPSLRSSGSVDSGTQVFNGTGYDFSAARPPGGVDDFDHFDPNGRIENNIYALTTIEVEAQRNDREL